MPSRIPVRIAGSEFYSRRASAPSKLEQLAANYQRKLYKEKEKKLIQLYQDESDNVLRRIRSYGSAGNNISRGHVGMNNGYGGRDAGMVREFFQERRQLEQGEINNNQYYENINYHYQKKRSETQRGRSPGKPPIPQNRSAGRDKSKPLAPINRPVAGRQPQQNGYNNSVSCSPKPPVNSQPRFIRSHRRGSQSSGSDSPPLDLNNLPPDRALIPVNKRKNIIPAIAAPSSDQEHSGSLVSTPGSGSTRQKTGYAVWKSEQERAREGRQQQQPPSPQMPRRANQQVIKRSPQMPRKPVLPPALNKPPDKMSSFQKWQQEQDKAREDRLHKYNDQREQNGDSPEYNDSESDLSSSRAPVNRQTQETNTARSARSRPPSGKTQKKQVILKNTKPSDDSMSDEEDDEQVEMRRKQARLESLIEQQKQELDDMRRKRKQEEERERCDEEKRVKRMTAERERARRLEEAQEQDHRSRLSRRSSHSELNDGYHSNTPSCQGYHTPSRQGNGPSHQGSVLQNTSQSPAATPVMPSPPIRRKASLPRKKPVQQPRVPTPDNENTAFYLQSATAEGAVNDNVNLVPCHSCGRNFASDRLERHMKVCQGAAKKKRKVFDPVKMRSQGMEYEKYAKVAAKAKRQKTPPKKNWRTQHDNFIQSIRYAKKVTEIESTGGNIADLPPPPVTENPDYKQCPYCERRFAPTTADRHIPRCKDIKSRPAPPKQRRR